MLVTLLFISSFQELKCCKEPPQSLLFSKLNKPSSLSLSSPKKCSSPLVIFMAFSGHSPATPHLFFVVWTPGPPQNGASGGQSKGKQYPPSFYSQSLFWCSPLYHWLSRLWAHTTGSCPAFHPWGLPSISPQVCSQWVLLPVCRQVWGCLNPNATP